MSEYLFAGFALLFSIVVVWAVHRLIVGHVQIVSASGKTILGMDAVAMGVLFVAFILGEITALAESIKHGSSPHLGLTWHDVRLVLGTLAASLLIYVAIDRLQKWGR